MSFISFMNDVGTGIRSFFGAPVIAVKSALNGESIGTVLAEAFIPGVAVANEIKRDHAEAQSLGVDGMSDAEIIKTTYVGVGNIDIDGDGVTLADRVEDYLGVDLPYVGSDEDIFESEELKSGSGGGFNILGLVIPASVVGLLFLL